MKFERVNLPEQTYLYIEKTVPVDGVAISEAMAEGFGAIFTFTEENDIERLTMPSAIYMKMPDQNGMSFRTAVFIGPADAEKASAGIKADTMPAGEAIKATHIGSYANMNQTHQAVWAYMAENNIPGDMPIWEIYVDDPAMVEETICRTDIYRRIG
jgi:effector-binding domain-containing protein